ncbi:MAG: Ppx/GppA family phosphatase, partial [Pseudomonadota bacterium]
MQRVGVIDIGSNSVRLVVFTVTGTAMYPTFNEKVMAGLGQGLGETGKLSPAGRELALAALARFRAILTGLGVEEVRIVATAAVRVAKDGRAFAKEAAETVGAELSILSGLDEGRLSALGVATGFYQPDGVVADLGGSSLELFRIGDSARSGETHMLGPLALHREDLKDEDTIRAEVRRVLSKSKHVSQGIRTIYAVGGAWRGFAKVVMHQSDYPLRVLHGFSLTPEDVEEATGLILKSIGDKALSDIAGRRASKLHLTSIVLDELTQSSGAERVVISSTGLREGVVAEHLDLAAKDSLADGLATFGALTPQQRRFSEKLFRFTRPIFEEKTTAFDSWEAEDRLHMAACLLVDSAARYHPDHRDAMAFEKALYTPLSGVSHTERVFLAAAIGWRYSRRFSVPKALANLLSSKQLRRARQVGHSMRLGAVLSGRSADILKRAALQKNGECLVLRL